MLKETTTWWVAQDIKSGDYIRLRSPYIDHVTSIFQADRFASPDHIVERIGGFSAHMRAIQIRVQSTMLSSEDLKSFARDDET